MNLIKKQKSNQEEIKNRALDIRKKYQFQLKKFNLQNIEKLYDRYKGRKETVSFIDIDYILKELNFRTNQIESKPTTKYEKVDFNEITKEYSSEEAIYRVLTLLKRELPKMLKITELKSPLLEKEMRKDKTGIVLSNYHKFLDLQEVKIKYSIQFCLNVYRSMMKNLNGKGVNEA